MVSEKTRTEVFSINGEDLVSTVKNLVHEGNIRRIAIENKDGRTLLEIPLTLGVVGVLLLPTLAALGALAAIVTECKIVVERIEEDSAD
jgi:CBS domain-containing protein